MTSRHNESVYDRVITIYSVWTQLNSDQSPSGKRASQLRAFERASEEQAWKANSQSP